MDAAQDAMRRIRAWWVAMEVLGQCALAPLAVVLGPDGQLWQADPAFMDEFLVAVSGLYWQEAAQRRMGGGLQLGLFLAPTRRRLAAMGEAPTAESQMQHQK